MSDKIITRGGPTIELREAARDVIEAAGAGTWMLIEDPETGAAAGVFLALQDMRDLLSKLAASIQPAAERADELGLDDQDGPVDPTASAP